MRIVRSIQTSGFRLLFLKALRKLLKVDNDINLARERVCDHLHSLHGGVVAYGPFRGMALVRDVWWGSFDYSAKVLGVYEGHVLNEIVAASKAINGPFIDIGAADGYYTTGVALSGLAEKVYAYEISAEGRQKVRESARRNGCEESVEIRGVADFSELSKLVEKHSQALILIDIEGAEYDLLDKSLLAVMSNCVIIVELHPWLAEKGQDKQSALMVRSEQSHRSRLIEAGPINIDKFEELRGFDDNHRLLAFSEGRKQTMQWLVLTPT